LSLLYCIQCNKVYATKDNGLLIDFCKEEKHKLADITNKQYINWLLNDRTPLKFKIKEKVDAEINKEICEA